MSHIYKTSNKYRYRCNVGEAFKIKFVSSFILNKEKIFELHLNRMPLCNHFQYTV